MNFDSTGPNEALQATLVVASLFVLAPWPSAPEFCRSAYAYGLKQHE
jgi:hypothetical protein